MSEFNMNEEIQNCPFCGEFLEFMKDTRYFTVYGCPICEEVFRVNQDAILVKELKA